MKKFVGSRKAQHEPQKWAEWDDDYAGVEAIKVDFFHE